MRRSPLLFLLLCASSVGAACTPSEPTSAPDDPPSLDGEPLESQTSEVARAFAIAMSEAGVRTEVRDAMRDSPWARHALDLSAFLSTDGARTERQMARALDMAPRDLRRVVETLPALDLYVPARTMRMTWRGGGDVAVYASLDLEGGQVFGFGTDGSPVSPRGVSYEATFVIEPAGRRIPYFAPEPSDPSIIQGADEVSTYFKWVAADGTVVEGTYADLRPEYRNSGGPMTTTPSNGDTDVPRIGANFCDGPSYPLGGDLEIRIDATFLSEAGYLIGTGEFYDGSANTVGELDWDLCNQGMRFTGYPTPYPLLIPWVLPPGQDHYVVVEMWEEDGVGDDFIGTDTLLVGADSVHFGGCAFGNNCGYALVDYPSISTAVFDSVYLPPMTVTEGQASASPIAQAWDQYQFPLSGYSAGSWGTASPSIATASGAGGMMGTLTGHNDGSTTYHATVSGKQGEGSVTVFPCSGHECVEHPRGPDLDLEIDTVSSGGG